MSLSNSRGGNTPRRDSNSATANKNGNSLLKMCNLLKYFKYCRPLDYNSDFRYYRIPFAVLILPSSHTKVLFVDFQCGYRYSNDTNSVIAAPLNCTFLINSVHSNEFLSLQMCNFSKSYRHSSFVLIMVLLIIANLK